MCLLSQNFALRARGRESGGDTPHPPRARMHATPKNWPDHYFEPCYAIATYGGREVQCRRRPTVGPTSLHIGPTSLRHRSDVGPTSLRRCSDIAPMSLPHRSDVGPTSLRRRSDIGPTSLRCRSDIVPNCSVVAR